jgi:hypothetical protein
MHGDPYGSCMVVVIEEERGRKTPHSVRSRRCIALEASKLDKHNEIPNVQTVE